MPDVRRESARVSVNATCISCWLAIKDRYRPATTLLDLCMPGSTLTFVQFQQLRCLLPLFAKHLRCFTGCVTQHYSQCCFQLIDMKCEAHANSLWLHCVLSLHYLKESSSKHSLGAVQKTCIVGELNPACKL